MVDSKPRGTGHAKRPHAGATKAARTAQTPRQGANAAETRAQTGTETGFKASMMALAKRLGADPGTVTFGVAPEDRAEVAETPPPTAKQLGLTGREAYVYTLEHPVRRKAGHGGDASAGVPSPEERTTLCDAARVPAASPQQLFLEKHLGLFLEAIADRFAEPQRHKLRMRLAGPGGKQIVDRFAHKLAGFAHRTLRCDSPVDIDGETFLLLGLEVLGISAPTAHDLVKRRTTEDGRRHHLAEFLGQRLRLPCDEGRVSCARLHGAYLAWCKQNPALMRGEEPFKVKAMVVELLKSPGVKRIRMTGGERGLRGIDIAR